MCVLHGFFINLAGISHVDLVKQRDGFLYVLGLILGTFESRFDGFVLSTHHLEEAHGLDRVLDQLLDHRFDNADDRFTDAFLGDGLVDHTAPRRVVGNLELFERRTHTDFNTGFVQTLDDGEHRTDVFLRNTLGFDRVTDLYQFIQATRCQLQIIQIRDVNFNFPGDLFFQSLFQLIDTLNFFVHLNHLSWTTSLHGGGGGARSTHAP
ncbi:hypothetical protein D3C87_1187170 [compost metagenome]